MVEAFHPQPQLYLSDPLLSQGLMSHPSQNIVDVITGNHIEYRCFGASNNKKADSIIMIPGLSESNNDSVYLFSLLEKYGYRGYIVDLTDYIEYEQVTLGILQFCAKLKINRCHLLGTDFGGFICLQIASYPNISKEISILSITLINSYSSTNFLTTKSFNKLMPKSNITKNLDRVLSINPSSRSAKFIKKDLTNIQSTTISNRFKLLFSETPKLDSSIPNQIIMSIECNDRILVIPDDALPSAVFPNCRLAIMKNGGDWPHIESPEDTLQFILAHIHRFGDVPNLDKIIGNEQTEQQQEEQEQVVKQDEKQNEEDF